MKALSLFIGKGTYKWKKDGAVYDGDWRNGKRNGFGTYSIPTEDGGYKKVYSGGWKNDMKHVRAERTLLTYIICSLNDGLQDFKHTYFLTKVIVTCNSVLYFVSSQGLWDTILF